jgi:hypothetical protein
MTKSICIIDDEEIDVYQVDRLLKKCGSFLFFYSDEKEALGHYKNSRNAREKPKEI